jgi:putative peptide zinc metalloprotease protein
VGVLASVVLATAFHELGHASACRYGGACPGVMGVGVYLVWPAFYCDVTDAYRLNRAGRLRTDLGGVYFNAIFVLLAGAFYLVTGVEAALLAAFVQHIIILQQLLPLLRFDGYYVLSDLTGVPDILSRVKPIFRSLVPNRALEPRVAELKPWVRIVVTAYLIAVIPVLVFLLVWIVMATPRMVATAYDSMGLQLDRVRSAAGADEIVLGGFQMFALTMPLAAMSMSLGRTGRMAGRGLIRWAGGSTARTVATAMSTVALLAAAGYVLWPNGDYEPIRPGERGTVGEAVESLPAATTGRPFFTPERAERYEPVPTVREQRSPLGRGRSDEEPAAPERGRDAPGERDTPADGSEDAPPGRAGEGTDTAPGATSSPSAPGAATPAPAPGGSASPEPAATADPGATAEPTATPTPTPTATATPAGTPEADSLESGSTAP